MAPKGTQLTPAVHDQDLDEYIQYGKIVGSNGEVAEVVDGKLKVDAEVNVDSVVIENVVITESALPTGAATAAKQDTAAGILANILATLSADPATQTTLAAVLAALQDTLAVEVTGSIPLNYEELTVDNTVGGVALTPAKYAGASRAFIYVDTADVRFRMDGQGAVTSAVGLPGVYRATIELTSLAEIVAFRAIRTGSVSALLRVYYSA